MSDDTVSPTSTTNKKKINVNMTGSWACLIAGPLIGLLIYFLPWEAMINSFLFTILMNPKLITAMAIGVLASSACLLFKNIDQTTRWQYILLVGAIIGSIIVLFVALIAPGAIENNTPDKIDYQRVMKSDPNNIVLSTKSGKIAAGLYDNGESSLWINRIGCKKISNWTPVDTSFLFTINDMVGVASNCRDKVNVLKWSRRGD